MTQKEKKKKRKLQDIHTKRGLAGDHKRHRPTCLLERTDEGKRKERQRGEASLGAAHPFIACAGEEGGLVYQPGRWTAL